MPDVVLLSEVHPSETGLVRFNPYDPVQQFVANYGGLTMNRDDVEAVFLSRIGYVFGRCAADNKKLVLRDHSHFDFLARAVGAPRLRELLAPGFRINSLISIRDPIDNFLSARASGFLRRVPTFDEFLIRYLAFLKTYDGSVFIKFEDFLRDTDRVLMIACGVLGLKFSDTYRDRVKSIRLTGSSGRRGETTGIAPQARRSCEPKELREMLNNHRYRQLAALLGY